MANQEQLRILKDEGVEAWNEWRKNNPDIEIDLQKANFYKAHLPKANFFQANLKKVNLREANLDGADFQEADLQEAKFYKAHLPNANFFQAKLKKVNLREAHLEGADFQEADLQEAKFYKAHLPNANFSTVNLKTVNLREANLEGADLQEADLQRVDLSSTYLNQANFNKADLRNCNLSGRDLSSTNLDGANLVDANLSNANLSGKDLSEKDLSGQDRSGVNLSGVILTGSNLSGCNLSRTNLSGVNLSGFDFSGANFSETNLSRIQALGTNFSNTTLTGACIEDWKINSKTNFENVICDYIYRKEGQQERRPSDPNRNFAPGDFAKLVEKSIETVDLIFKDGIDWKAFLSSYQDIQVEYGDQNVSIQAIEKKSDGAFVIRLNVPPDANKANIESQIDESYRTKLQVLEAKYRAELQAKDKEITIYKQQSADMMEIVKLQASRPINVEAKAVSGERNINTGGGEYRETNLQDNSRYVETRDSSTYYENYNSPQEKTLAEAAAEIQKLLQQLEQTNPTATVEQQKAYVDAAISPTLKQRFVGALTSGGETAIEEFLDNPYIKVGKAIVKGWIKPD